VTDEAQVPNTSAESDSTEDSGETVETPQRTAEEVEAEWRRRVSGKDAAHAAEAKALRERLAELERAEAERRAKSDTERAANMTETERQRQRADDLERRLEEERQQRVVDTRKAKYPHIAAELDEPVLAAMDEGRLAALDARLSPAGDRPTGNRIDPNSPPRPGGEPPRPDRKSIADLKADLKREAPGWLASIKGN
jgi:hypothetical protein